MSGNGTTMTATRAILRPRALIAVGLLTLLAAAPAPAQTWQEPPYNPPVGSRWLVQSTTHTVEVRANDVHTESTINIRSELTIDGKTADGFRVTLVNRDMAVTGDPRKVAIVQPMLSVLKGVVVHARTDARGAPVAVENIEEVRARMQAAIDRLLAKFQDKPAVATFMRQLMAPMLKLEGKDAATAYLDNLPQLAVGQNTRLKPGEVRTTTDNVKSPIGNVTIKSNVTLRIDKFDTASGKVRFVRERKLDPESLKTFALTVLKQLGAAADKPLPPEALTIMKTIKFSLNDLAEIDVEGGMTRAIHKRSTTLASAMGHTLSKNETVTLTVTPAP
jgi:hypothetical protein